MGKCKTSVFKRPDTKVYFFHGGAFFYTKVSLWGRSPAGGLDEGEAVS